MKRFSSLWQKLPELALVAILACAIFSCSKDNELPVTPGIIPAQGEMDFNINTGNDSDNNKEENIPVEQGDTVNLHIKQRSSYTDPNGTVFVCEPVASVSLFATMDTVFAKDINALTNIVGQPTVKNSQAGSNPICHATNQSFRIGGQEVVFNLMHEVFLHKNSLQQQIEMPYIKVNQANFGQGNANETRSMHPAISLRRISLTRASVTDTTMFEVKATFNVALESVNTKSAKTDTVSFDVAYVGVVEEVSELTGNISYVITQDGNEVNSPFHIKGSGNTEISIEQTSTFSAKDSVYYSAKPKASITLKVGNDTAFVENLKDLSTQIETEDPTSSETGTNPVQKSMKQTFATASQTFDFHTMYEICTAETEDVMPYIEISQPVCKGFEVKERVPDSETRAFIYDTVFYDVKAKFEVELKGVNVGDELIDTLFFEVDYTGAVVNATEIVELDSITYRKRMVYYEAHDNLAARAQAEVYRDRHYSDGHVETDELIGAPWFAIERGVSLGNGMFDKDSLVVNETGLSIFYNKFNWQNRPFGDLSEIYSGAVQIPDFEHLHIRKIINFENEPGTWSEYQNEPTAPTYEVYFNFNPEEPEEGWYFNNIEKNRNWMFVYSPQNEDPFLIRMYYIGIFYYDRFLYIDGQIIDFAEYRPTYEYIYSEEEYPGSETRGPGRIFKCEVVGEYLEHEIYYATIDTIYTPKN